MPVPAEWLSTMVNGKKQNGLQGTYFNNISLSGNPVLDENGCRQLIFNGPFLLPHLP